MSTKLVKKCDCCGVRFSKFLINEIRIEHAEQFVSYLEKALIADKRSGVVDLLCSGDEIVGIYYEYANKKEAKQAEAICEYLLTWAEDFYVLKQRDAELIWKLAA